MSARTQCTAFVGLLFAFPALQAATITVVNLDGASEGFNDPTVLNEADGFPAGTTRGQKRLAVFQMAAAQWAGLLTSSIEIKVGAKFDPKTCSQFSAVLGSAGPTASAANFPNAPLASTSYPIALAEALANANLNSSSNEINATFNSALDDGCFGGGAWWYATNPANPNPGNRVSLFPVVLHELGHGLGFTSFVCVNIDMNNMPAPCPTMPTPTPFGAYLTSTKDIWSTFLFDNSAAKLWSAMTDGERAASIVNQPNLVWKGANVTAAIPTFQPGGQGTTSGFMRMYAPAAIEPGSSVSHWTDAAASPDLLMEPALANALFNQIDLTAPLFRDIGWQATDVVNVIFTNGFESP